MNNFPENLRKLMAVRGLNQVELAKLSGVRQQYISRYLNEDPQGKEPRDIETLLALCRALECTLYDLTGIPELAELHHVRSDIANLSEEAVVIAKRFDKLSLGDSRRGQIWELLQGKH